VATSERILTTLASSADVHPLTSGRSFMPIRRPGWRRAILDYLAISLGLILVPAAFGESLVTPVPHYLSLPPLALAMMITTIFAFAGTYPPYRTPLDIADTEGLVRGVACAAMLVIMGSIGIDKAPDKCAFLTAGFVVALLVLRCEVAHLLSGNQTLQIRSALPVSLEVATEEAAIVSAGEGGMLLENPYETSPAGELAKRIVDVVGASVVFILAFPLFLAVALLIKIDSKGPIFIRQQRIGRRGVPFYMWKFRSMYSGVPRYARSPVSDTDPRLTRLGRALRRMSIDELPQLLNVLKGDMSLVGPRPEMPFIVRKYRPRERLRLNAVPGITGLWQISPARAMPIHQNLYLDLFYIENRNIFLDLAILLRTVTAVVRGIGAT
jgi:lipopolysaccharide/colanic/teichoic acid biosynthesis glycosyltransferase